VRLCEGVSPVIAIDGPARSGKKIRERRREAGKEHRQSGRHEIITTKISLELLFSTCDVVIVDRAPCTRSEAVLKVLQDEADGEGRGRVVAACSHLDRGATGCLLVALHSNAARFLAAAQAEGHVRVIYQALVWGRLPADGEIRAKLLVAGSDAEHRAHVSPKGRPAITRFKSIAVYEAPSVGNSDERRQESSVASADDGKHRKVVTLVECEPVTGHPDQVCAHLHHIGHRLVGDTKYGREAGARDLAWCPRLFLHCTGVEGQGLSGHFRAESPLRPDIAAVLDRLQPERSTNN